MLDVVPTKPFKRDLKKYQFKKDIVKELYDVISILSKQEPLDSNKKDHPLIGNYVNYREYHVKNDTLLIYKQDPTKDPEVIVAANPDYNPVHDQGEIELLVDKVLAENAQSIADFKSGRDKAFAFLVGQVMKMTKGKASPAVVNDLLKQKIEKSS